MTISVGLEPLEVKRASVIGSIVGVGSEIPGMKTGRPKEARETQKRVSLSVLPSLYEDIQKIAYVQHRSTSDLVAALLEQYRVEHGTELVEYETITKGH